jgi:Tfp pilus assembly protein FimT
MMKSMRKRSGFFTLELLCVLVTTGFAAALVAPKLQRTIDRSRVRTAGALIGSAVARAKVVAAARGCEAVVHIGSGTDARVSVTTCRTSGGTAALETVSVSQVAAAFDGSVTTTIDRIGFTAAGVRTTRESGVVRLIDGEGAVADSIMIDPVGHVRRI